MSASGVRLPGFGPGRTAAAIVVLVSAACGVTALAQPPVPDPPTDSAVTVEAAVLACPPAPRSASARNAASVVTVGVPQADPALVDTAEGRAVLAPLGQPTEPFVTLDGGLEVGTVRGSKADSVVARAEGSLAPNVGGGLVAEVREGRGRGLMVTRCEPPSGDAWFVGGGSFVGRRTTVRLTNADSSPAVVDVSVYGPRGPIDAGRGEGVEVPPHSERSLRLDVLAPGNARTAVHVVARAGRVSTAVTDVNTLGLIPRGADYVPVSAAPSEVVVVPGVSGGATGARQLQVLAPGETDAIVEVQLVATDGTFAPESAAVVEVAAGTVAQVDLAPSLAGAGASAVLLTSDTPVVAGVRTVVPLTERRVEVSYSAGTPAIAGPASFGPIQVDPAHRAALVLTAPAEAGLVEVRVVSPDGAVDSQQIPVATGTTRRVVLAETPPGSAVLLGPAPGDQGSGPVVAALQLSVKDSGEWLVSSVPLISGVASVTVLPVLPDPATGVPGH